MDNNNFETIVLDEKEIKKGKTEKLCKKLSIIRNVLLIIFLILIIISVVLLVISSVFTGFFVILIGPAIFIIFSLIEFPLVVAIIVLSIVISIKRKKYGIIISRKDMNYRSIESLERIERLCEETDLALDNKRNRRRSTPFFIGFIIVGGVLVLCLLFAYLLLVNLGTVGLSAAGITSALAAIGLGGGMVGGIFVLGLIIALPPIVAGSIFFAIRELKFKVEKDSLYKEALKKQEAVVRALKEERDADSARIEYLNELNILLKRTIRELNEDRGVNETAKA